MDTLAAARDAARQLRAGNPTAAVHVQLLPGTHGLEEPLSLGAEDSGVRWHGSPDPEAPSVVSGGTRVTGWAKSADVKGALVAPLPPAIPKGSTLRQLWVGGQRAERTTTSPG